MRVIKIEKCADCPYYRDGFTGSFCSEKRTKDGLMRRILKRNGFPEWCPLKRHEA